MTDGPGHTGSNAGRNRKLIGGRTTTDFQLNVQPTQLPGMGGGGTFTAGRGAPFSMQTAGPGVLPKSIAGRYTDTAPIPGWLLPMMLVLLMVSVPDLQPVRRFILVYAVASPVLLFMLWRWSPAGAIGIVALSHLLVLFPTLTPNSQWLVQVARRYSMTTSAPAGSCFRWTNLL